jgi:hypothetical protein
MIITKGDSQEVWDAIRSEESLFDFEKLVPMPSEVKESEKSFEYSRGVPLWYTWSLEHWGTKCGACDPAFEEVEETKTGRILNGLSFWTANSPPEPIFALLAEKFPEHEIEVLTTLHDGNYWHFTYTLKKGRLIRVEEECRCFGKAFYDQLRSEDVVLSMGRIGEVKVWRRS